MGANEGIRKKSENTKKQQQKNSKMKNLTDE